MGSEPLHPVQVVSFHRLLLGGEALPIALGGDWSIAAILRSPSGDGVRLELRHGDGRLLRAMVEPRGDGQRFTSTEKLDLWHHPIDWSADSGEEVGAVLRALASRLAAAEGALTMDDVRAALGVSTDYRPSQSARDEPARRLRLDVVTEGELRAPEASTPWQSPRTWPVAVAAFHAAYFEGAALPLPLAPGWTLDALSAARVVRGVEARLRRDDGRSFVVLIEPKSANDAFLRTQYLNLSHQGTGEGLRGEDQAVLMRALGARLASVEDRIAPAAIASAFQTVARSDDEALVSTRPVDFRINRECNEYCLFCNTPPDADRILESSKAVFASIETEYRNGFRTCYFNGREPTLDPNLPDYIRHAREVGFREIGMHTNGTTLSKRTFVDRLVGAGLTTVQVSMHTFDPTTFEKLVGAPRLLEKTLEGLRNVADHSPLHLYLLFVVTTLNQSEMPDFVSRVARDYGSRVEFVLFSPMAPMGDGVKHPELLPHFDTLKDSFRRTLERAREVGVEVRIPDRCGLPLCAMPEEHIAKNLELRNPPGDNLEPNKTKLPVCVTCRWDSRCSGVWSGYVSTHGPAMIRPVAA